MASAAERLRAAVRIERHRYGPRVYLLGHRMHECAVGLAATGDRAQRRARRGGLARARRRGGRRGRLARDQGLARPVPVQARHRHVAPRDPPPLRGAPPGAAQRAPPAARSPGSARDGGGQHRLGADAARSRGAHSCSASSRRTRSRSFTRSRCRAGAALAVVAFYLWAPPAPRGPRRRRAARAARRAQPAQGPRLRGGDALLGARRRPLVGAARVQRPSRAGDARGRRSGAGCCSSARRGRSRWPRWRSPRRRAPARSASCAETVALLTWNDTGLPLGDLDWLRLGVPLLGLWTLVAAAYLLFRPLAAPHQLPGRDARRAALSLVRAHGRDTLSFFKLRQDAHYHFFAADGRAFLALPRRERRAARLRRPGRPRRRAARASLRELCALRRGARPADRRRSAPAPRCSPLYRRRRACGALYLGDEAIVDTAAFSLEGRRDPEGAPVGQPARGRRVHGRGRSTLGELDDRDRRGARARLRAAGATGAPERGFSMAMDSLRGAHQTAASSWPRGTPTARSAASSTSCPRYGRPAMSLSLMRRDRDTPNGLMEFLVVRAIELLRRARRGRALAQLRRVRALARTARAARRERLLGAAGDRLANPFFQIESLLPLQREVRPALGAALPALRGRARPPARRPRGHADRGPAAQLPVGASRESSARCARPTRRSAGAHRLQASPRPRGQALVPRSRAAARAPSLPSPPPRRR